MLSGVVPVLQSLRLPRIRTQALHLSPLLRWFLRRGRREYLSLCLGQGGGCGEGGCRDWIGEEEGRNGGGGSPGVLGRLSCFGL